MDVGVYSFPHGDSVLIDKIVNEFLSEGKFDKLRKECMSDADTKPAYQNLQQRVESTVAQFLQKQIWKPDLNKNQLRDSLRKHILESNFFDAGINRIVDQVVNPNVLATVFLPEVEETVYNYLSIPKPTDKAQKKDTSFLEEKVKPPGIDSSFKQISNNTLNNSKNCNWEVNSDENTKAYQSGVGNSIKTEVEAGKTEDTTSLENMELPSDESQESYSRIGVERLQINEESTINLPDSDDSVPLEINEKSLSDSRDSEDSIMNQMSPISQGRLTPDLIDEKIEKEEKVDEKLSFSFIGQIPKLKREDSESIKFSKKEELVRSEKGDKSVYTSDESDSSKSYIKSDCDDRKSKDKKEGTIPLKDDKYPVESNDKKRKEEDRYKSSKDKDRDKDRKSRDYKPKDKSSKDKKRERSRDRSRSVKKGSSSSSSSLSRERSSSHHKSSHQSRHKDYKSKEEKKRKEEEKKKNKTIDDHGKERNKKDDRRSTDRDSNERDKSSGSRNQGESRKRERDQKTEEGRGYKNNKEEAEVENDVEAIAESEDVENDTEKIAEPEEMVIEMDEDWVPEGEGIVLVNEKWICSENMPQHQKNCSNMIVTIQPKFPEKIGNEEENEILNFNDLYKSGVLSKVEFPKLTDDFYVKFSSTGFKYFEEWEKSKLDCEEEFKEFVDEAENNLSLLSDDEYESSGTLNFDEENRITISNVLKGLGNFKKGLMFDPNTLNFYKWKSNKFYQKFKNKTEKKWQKHLGKNVLDESVKENIDKGCVSPEKLKINMEKNKENQIRETKALHLKLLNKYKRRAIRLGKQKRRQKRKFLLEGIKEKNENPNASKTLNRFSSETEYLFGSEGLVVNGNDANFFMSNLTRRIPCSKTNNGNKFEFSPVKGVPETPDSTVESSLETVQIENYQNFTDEEFSRACRPKTDNVKNSGNNNLSFITARGNSPETESSEMISFFSESTKTTTNQETQKKRKEMVTVVNDSKIKNDLADGFSQKCQLPPSPESDDSNPKNNGIMMQTKMKRILKLDREKLGIPKKQSRRNYNQKYDSQDLYKPRPVLNRSRTRARSEKVEDKNNLL